MNMADNQLTENDEDDIVIIEGEAPVEEAATEEADNSDDDDDDDDDGDERLGDSEDDSDEEIARRSRSNVKRMKQRERQKRAKEHADRELAELREQNDALLRRVSVIEGNTLASNVSAIDQRIAQAQADVKQAESIIARAVEAGNGDDVATAMRLRDEAQYEAQQLWQQKQQVEQARQQHANPGPDPRVVNYAKEWMNANPWYDPSGRDEDSAITKVIDNQLAAEGYNPKDADYWHELTRRVAARIGNDDDEAETRPSPTKRKAPPTGTTREHAPVSTKKEIYVTPERKQAMIDAGIWDDVPRRNQMLKAYQAYDKSSAR
jgi:hypothetical protein